MNLTFRNKRKAFTLIELLIVIAIIGILFIVLVSKVDFATDKAKTTGVQTDFRSFQVAFETVSRENAGFNTLGWDTGDIKRSDFATALPGYTYTNETKDAGDRVRNSYDVGDLNLNGELDSNETWTGRKIYTETWTSIYTLDNPGDASDKSGYVLLEEAINKNLDPKLQLTIDPDAKTFSMKNGYQDPWKTEYHGFYLSNAAVDGQDRGAILMYSDGPNKIFGSAQVIENGVVTIGVPQNNIQGQDDLSILTIYTYFNGYGENKTTTTGFSQNQSFLAGNSGNTINTNVAKTYKMVSGANARIEHNAGTLTFVSNAEFSNFVMVKVDDVEIDSSNYTASSGSTKIVLSQNYINSLSVGQHKLDIVSSDGIASCMFTVDINYTNFTITSSNRTKIGYTGVEGENLVIPATFQNSGKWYKVVSIGSMAFQGCTGLTSVTIPDSVTSFGNGAFRDCSGLTSVDLGNGVQTIGYEAFRGCTGLTSVTIPDSVTSIDNGAFRSCTGLTSVAIPDSVASIGGEAFSGCSGLTSVDLGNGVQTIGYYAFRYCTGLTSVTIPDSVTSIQWYAFSDCTGLTGNLVIPDSVTSIGDDAFYGCSGLTNLDLGDGVQTIGNYAFCYCTGLTSVTIPDSVTSIGDGAFRDCSGLTSVTIPDSVTSIGDWAFYTCWRLKNVYYTGTEEQWADISIGSNNSPLTSATIHYNYTGE